MQHQCSKVVKHLYSWCPIWHVWQIKHDLFKRGGNKSWWCKWLFLSLLSHLLSGILSLPSSVCCQLFLSFYCHRILSQIMMLSKCLMCGILLFGATSIKFKKINIEMNMTQRNIPEPNKVYDVPNRWKDYFFYIWWELEKLSIFA